MGKSLHFGNPRRVSKARRREQREAWLIRCQRRRAGLYNGPRIPEGGEGQAINPAAVVDRRWGQSEPDEQHRSRAN